MIFLGPIRTKPQLNGRALREAFSFRRSPATDLDGTAGKNSKLLPRPP